MWILLSLLMTLLFLFSIMILLLLDLKSLKDLFSTKFMKRIDPEMIIGLLTVSRIFLTLWSNNQLFASHSENKKALSWFSRLVRFN